MQPSKKYKLWPIDSPYAGLDLKTDCVYFQFGIVFANRVRCSKSDASKNTLTHLKIEEKKNTHNINVLYILYICRPREHNQNDQDSKRQISSE